MIEQCIFAVYQRDKKVFLPDFGAIIYAEFNDSIDFNDLLTFDDGKVVEEIQKHESLSEEEARNALIEYIQGIKDTLGEGKLHYFNGIGYLSKDSKGNFAIERSKPAEKTETKKSSKTKTADKAPKDDAAKQSKKKEEPSEDESAFLPPVIEDQEEDFTPFEEEGVEQSTEMELGTQGNDYTGAETEFEVEEPESLSSFSEKEEYPEYQEEYEERIQGNSAAKVIWIAVFVVILSVGGFYLYTLFFTPEIQVNTESSNATESTSVKTVVPETASNTNSTEIDEEIIADPVEPEQPISQDIEEDDEKKTFSLIFGGFKEERNADKYLRRLRQKGYEVEKFRGLDQLYFVGIEKIYGKSNAVKRLEDIRKSEPQVWIYNRGLLPNP